MPIHVDPNLLNTFYSLPKNVVVEAKQVANFVAATKNKQTVNNVVTVTKKLGYPNLLTPTTFNIILAQKADKQLLKNLLKDSSNITVIHVEQKIVNHNPTFVADILQVKVVVKKIVNRNSFVLLTTETNITTVNNVAKSTLTSTIMIKENLG